MWSRLCADCNFVVGAKCCEKRFWLCAFDLVLQGEEGGSSA
jgi:hypothetical protein